MHEANLARTPDPGGPDRSTRRRVAWTAAVAAGLVAASLVIPSSGASDGVAIAQSGAGVRGLSPGAATEDQGGAGGLGLAADGHTHDHSDPTTKNAISRAGEAGGRTADPTTAAQARANASYVARERALPDPQLRHVRAYQPRDKHPQTRFAMANGCYTLAGEPIYFKATDLGSYLLYDRERRFVTAGGERATEPGPDTVWTARKSGRTFAFTQPDGPLEIQGTSRFQLTLTSGCAPYPESQINVSGGPHAGVTPYQEVRGYVDAHTHGMAYEFLGGGVHCGKPWDPYGVPYALVDCPDHQTGTSLLETVLSGIPVHDPVGWPTFQDWPAPDSLTHEGTYYRWLERAWRGGQRLFVNLLVENNQLCQLYPLGPGGGLQKNSCDDMDSLRLQAKRMRQFQDYVDAQFGGPGKGFYRIVTNPFQARRVINAGKMAVVMGIETSVPFGCSFKALPGGDVPACDAETIDRWLDEVHSWGVRQMELVNKFDNALSGVTGDAGATGVVVNTGNFLETGTFWDMEHCEPEHPDAHDKNQLALPEISADQQDALFGAIGQLFGALGPQPPLYGTPDHCNGRGLTPLGEHVVKGLAERGMLFDPDHMSVKARNASLDLIEDMGYHGVLSSHSWSTEDAYPRIYRAGGFIAPYAGDSTGFVEKWRKHVGWADKRYYFGFGFGADINGLGAQGSPRGADVPNPVSYPFRGLAGVTIDKQHAGKRVFDLNVDGVAQYGLYPDWVEDLTKVAGADGAAIADDMARGAEAYLQMWERAEGIAPDSCRNPALRKPVATVEQLVRDGMTTTQVMRKVGQPYTRLGRTFGFCARTAGDDRVEMTVTFGPGGRVTGLRRG